MSSQQSIRRVLIIDDTETIHADIRKILSPPANDRVLDDLESKLFGDPSPDETPANKTLFKLDSAMQGEEGLQKVQTALDENAPYCMAFVDMRMPPGWDGLQTIEAIWKIDPDIQIAICTCLLYTSDAADE